MKPFRFLDNGAYDDIPQEASGFWCDPVINLFGNDDSESPREPRPDPRSPSPWN